MHSHSLIQCFNDARLHIHIHLQCFDTLLIWGTDWLKINGSDLKKIGCNGREIGKILDKLLLLAANEKIENIHSVLLEYAVNIKSAGD